MGNDKSADGLWHVPWGEDARALGQTHRIWRRSNSIFNFNNMLFLASLGDVAAELLHVQSKMSRLSQIISGSAPRKRLMAPVNPFRRWLSQLPNFYTLPHCSTARRACFAEMMPSSRRNGSDLLFRVSARSCINAHDCRATSG